MTGGGDEAEGREQRCHADVEAPVHQPHREPVPTMTMAAMATITKVPIAKATHLCEETAEAAPEA